MWFRLTLVALLTFAPACETTPRAQPASAADEGDDDVVRAPWGGLQVAERGRGEVAVVLLHGYGVRGDDLLGFANRLADDIPVLFVVPAAPILQDRGTGRAWFEPPRSLHTNASDRRQAEADIRRSRARLQGVLETLEGRGFSRDAIVVAGFSQGAMMSLDLALHTEPAVGGVALLSGGPLSGWPLERARGLRVLITHGHRDDVLPFSDAVALRERLEAAGADVDFLAFEGGHAVPPEVQARFVEWLGALRSR